MNDTVCILGAGFSHAAGLPTTRLLFESFLSLPETYATPKDLQCRISKHLRTFWETVFSVDGNHDSHPSFEDHFTVLDLAANTGHNLGPEYSPAKLRAIRRLSIHRVFDILDSSGSGPYRYAVSGINRNPNADTFLQMLATGVGNSIVSTNWDMLVEAALDQRGYGWDYGVEVKDTSQLHGHRKELPLLKLQGSSNWAYCDCCRRLFAGSIVQGKTLLHGWTFLERRDFICLGDPDDIGLPRMGEPMHCTFCGTRLSARVATFSYAKAYDFSQFHGVWGLALQKLRDAKHWLFIGYSLPESDFELRHMLKVAELGRTDAPTISVVLHDDPLAMKRFDRFFGSRVGARSAAGFDEWVETLKPVS